MRGRAGGAKERSESPAREPNLFKKSPVAEVLLQQKCFQRQQMQGWNGFWIQFSGWDLMNSLTLKFAPNRCLRGARMLPSFRCPWKHVIRRSKSGLPLNRLPVSIVEMWGLPGGSTIVSWKIFWYALALGSNGLNFKWKKSGSRVLGCLQCLWWVVAALDGVRTLLIASRKIGLIFLLS